MKTLYVLRHGHAAPEAAGQGDYVRALTSRGAGEARRSAESLLQRGQVPSLVLSSGATRARQTAELCAATWPAGTELRILDELYLAGPSSYLAALAALADPHPSTMVVGHNPGLEELVFMLTERSEHLPTAGLVEIDLPVTTWADLSTARRGLGQLVRAAGG